MWVIQVSFGEVDSAGEEDDANEEEENKQAKFPHAGLQSLAENLETFAMPTEFEHTKDTNQANNTKNSEGHGLIAASAGRRRGHVASFHVGVLRFVDQLHDHGAKGHEVRHNGKQVDQVHQVAEESVLVGTSSEAYNELGHEPQNANGLDDEERLAESRYVVLLDGGLRSQSELATVLQHVIHYSVHFVLWNCLPTEGHDGQDDDDDGEDCYHSSWLTWLWKLQQ